MSRVGRSPIPLPEGVKVKIEGNTIEVEGPKGKLSYQFHPSIKVIKEDGTLKVERTSEEKFFKALHGLTRTLINNMIEGVTKGFSKELEVVGVGYSARMEGKKLVLQVGYSHPVIYESPPDVEISVRREKNFIITVQGIDKQKVGQVSAIIRSFRPPDPYKGKGIRYRGEVVKLKAGKTG